ncbi:ECF transporter S component [Alkalihalobacillus sp. MEB130]|uniref:ECF transporter S component n=1 Tax=Alkalihalobacillus sp. MEB130 TaxID=2976704 RepID=UPI0028DDE6BC|nr:ECF transporter S component [Alkalihalobacillus sp. MEB130]MDT8862157.1 ECF transporter S component [Alkalihalobacillus sp. MEB130]
MPIRRITLLAMLSALCVVGRMAFVHIPNVQPVTSIIIITAMFLGPSNGLILGFISTVLTNMALGTGIWTVWQIVSWSLIGLVSGWLGRAHSKWGIPFILLIMYAGFCGYLYGFVISLNMLVITERFLAYYLAGLPFDTNHAIGNMVFFALLYPILSKILMHYLNKGSFTSV